MLRSLNFASRLLIIVSMALALLLPVVATTANAAGDVIYQGAFDTQDLSWFDAQDGTVIPVLPGTHSLGDTDLPDLTGRSFNLLVPLDVVVGGVEVVPLSTHVVRPPTSLHVAGKNMSSENVAGEQAIHGTREASTYPAAWGRFGGSQIYRGFRLVTVTVYPLRASRASDGTWSELEFLDSFEIRLQSGMTPYNPEDVAVRQRKVPGERQRLEQELRNVIDNPEALFGYRREDGVVVESADKGFSPSKTPSLSGSVVSYLIITNEEMAAAFQPLADHRTAQGLPAVIKTIEWIVANYRNGVDLQETVRMFIRDAYERWGVEYVLMGGDSDIIPARFVTSSFYPAGEEETTDIPADIYFSCLDGNWNADGDSSFGEPNVGLFNPGDDCDMANDVSFGRAPVSDAAAAATFASKVIVQEMTPAGSAFANRFLFAAEVLFTNIYGDITLDGADYAEELFDNVITPCTDMEVVRMYESYNARDEFDDLLYPGSVRETRAAVLDTLNTGRYGIFNQIGHGFFFDMSVGDRNITGGDVDLLINENTFLMYGLNCASAAFDYNCLMERLVRNPDGGSYASIGASRAAFPATANDFQVEFFDQLMCQDQDRLGDLIGLSRLPWLDFASSDSFTRWTYLNYTLLGDPAQKVWTAPPAVVDIQAPASLTTGEQTVVVTITSGGSQVEGARVTLARGDVYVRDVTDGNGQVALPVTLTDSGDLTLTVCGVNLEQTSQVIPVANPGSYIALETMTIIDDGTLGSSGNGNGVLEAGETAALSARFEDTGSGGATGLTAHLTTTSPGITIVDGDVPVPNIASGGSADATAPFLVSFNSLIFDGMLLEFRIEVEDGGDAWVSGWDTVMLAPELEPIALDWYDTFYGDGDGYVDDNERIGLVMRIQNYGAGFADVVTAKLRSDSPNVTLYDSLVTYTNLGLMDASNGDALFSLAVIDTSVPYDARIDFVDNMGRTFTHELQIEVPSIPTGFDFGLTLGSDVIELVWDAVEDENVRGYHVYRSDNEGGPYIRANQDLVEGTAYFRDDGLALLTRYYYRAAAVNTSLIEGARSEAVAKSTSPPETGNFPLPFGRETDSPCAVGDVTGDGRLEVVMTADQVYVWTAEGGELFDGDEDAQTIGPITNFYNGRLTAMAVTLADLDDEPGAEIICSDRDLKLIYIFKADGTIMPGWPQSTGAMWIWAPAAVGDIDGDGEPEIVANNLAKMTLAWNVDGTEVRDGDNNAATNGPLIDRRSELSWDGWNRSGPALFDLDHDGAKDIIFGTRYGWETMNSLRAYRWDGTTLPGFPIDTAVGGSIMVSPTVADLDGDGVWEIIFVSENDRLHVVHEDGSYYSGFPIYFRAQSEAGDRTCPSPAVGDFDGDGELEIVAVAVYSKTEAYIHVIDTDIAGGTSGTTMTGWPIHIPGNSNCNPVVGDINADGLLDVLLGVGGGDTETPNNLYAFSTDGTEVEGFPLTLGGPVNPTPVICDLDDDRDVDVVYGGWDLMIHVWDMPFAFDGTKAPWLTFRGNNTRDGVYRMISTTATPELPRPTLLTLEPNHPNPFNPSTEIKLYVPGEAGQVDLRVDIYDVAGRRVRSLHQGVVTPGWHVVSWQGRDDTGQPQASGVYFLRARTGGSEATIKMSLIK